MKLTPRQMQVAQLYAEGHTRKEIMLILNLARQTVETHLSAIYDRLGVHNKAQLTRIIWENT